MSAPLAGAPVAGLQPRKRAGGRKRARRWGVDVLGLLVLAVMIFPVYWMISTAFKPGSEIFANTPVWFPTHATLANFSDAIHRPHFWASVKNSVIVTTATTAATTALIRNLPTVLRPYALPPRLSMAPEPERREQVLPP